MNNIAMVGSVKIDVKKTVFDVKDGVFHFESGVFDVENKLSTKKGRFRL